MIGLVALLILAYGPLNWSFPWWVWLLCILFGGVSMTVKNRGRNED